MRGRARSSAGDEAAVRPRRSRRGRLRVAARPARGRRASGSRQDDRDRLRGRRGAVCARRCRAGTERGSGWQPERHGVPLCRRAERAQERAPARAGVRAPRRGRAGVRRRRAAAVGARGPGPASGSSARSSHRRGPDLDGRSGRRLPAEPRRAVRVGDAGGHGLGPLRRGDERRRPAGVRPGRGRRARRPGGRGRRSSAALATAAALPRPNETARQAALEHDVRRQAERVEELLARAARDRRA